MRTALRNFLPFFSEFRGLDLECRRSNWLREKTGAAVPKTEAQPAAVA